MCELLAAKGYDVVPTAQREARLKELADRLEARWGITVHPLPCDLAASDAAVSIRDELGARALAVDVLVNCAGYALNNKYLDEPWEAHHRFLRVLAITPSELCRYFLPGMVERGWGRIINMASVSGVMSGSPGFVFYAPSKSFLVKFSEGLAEEYEESGINCTAVLVGATDTELMRTPHVWKIVKDRALMQLATRRPETVARQAYAACMRQNRVVAPGVPTKVWAFCAAHMPPKVRYSLVRWSAEMPDT